MSHSSILGVRALMLLTAMLILGGLTACQSTLGPTNADIRIAKFYPDVVATNATDTVIGRGFGSRPAALTASIGDVLVKIVSASDTMVVIATPRSSITDTIHIKREEVWASADKPLRVTYGGNTILYGIVPAVAPRGAKISVYAPHLDSVKEPLVLLIDGLEVPIDSVYGDHVTCIIPDYAHSGDVVLGAGNTKLSPALPLSVIRQTLWKTVRLSANGFIPYTTVTQTGWSNYRRDTINRIYVVDSIRYRLDEQHPTDNIPVTIEADGYSWRTDLIEGSNVHRFIVSIHVDTIHNIAMLSGSVYNDSSSVDPNLIDFRSIFGFSVEGLLPTGSVTDTLSIRALSGVRCTDFYYDTRLDEADHQGEHHIFTNGDSSMIGLTLFPVTLELAP